VPEATILEAIKIMLKNHISGMPVIDSKGRLVGILTEGDFLRRAENVDEEAAGNAVGIARQICRYRRASSRPVGQAPLGRADDATHR
jgi:CBS domain-containing protein